MLQDPMTRKPLQAPLGEFGKKPAQKIVPVQTSKPAFFQERKEGDSCGVNCHYCNAPMYWARDSRDTFWRKNCPNYPGCRNTAFQKPDQKPAISEDVRKHFAEVLESFKDSMRSEIREEIRLDMAKEIAKRIHENQPKEIVWKVNERQIGKIEGTCHSAMFEIMKRIKANYFQNFLVVGPAGSGKTTLAQNLATALNLNFASISCSGGMPEWYLTGRSMPNLQTGESNYQISKFVELFENGGVFLLDEMDAADPNVLILINSALANGIINLPARQENPVAKRHKDFYLIAAANTYGNGANLAYQGRNALDAATLDRFVGATITVDYDQKLEEKLVPEADLTLRIWEMRKRLNSLKLRRILGTRALLAAAYLYRSGESLRNSIDAILVGWSDDEKNKVCPEFYRI